MPECGSQIVLCDLPIHFDTYRGCSHACAYCFAARKMDLGEIQMGESTEALSRFIQGGRTQVTSWCDWQIPLHWGGLSDPFQPAEREHGRSLACLRLLAKTGYPFVVSTKSTLIGESPYFELFEACNVALQISLVSPQYDNFERGAPSFNERRLLLAKMAPVVKRLIVRIQPYALGLCGDILSVLPDYANAGVYGVAIEGMKRQRRADGMVKVGSDFCYPVDKLSRDYERIRSRCRELGLAFFCAENRLRSMGDDPCCCGVTGLPGFQCNTANMNHMDGKGAIIYTEQMRQPKTAYCFKGMVQDTIGSQHMGAMSFANAMEIAKR